MTGSDMDYVKSETDESPLPQGRRGLKAQTSPLGDVTLKELGVAPELVTQVLCALDTVSKLTERVCAAS